MKPKLWNGPNPVGEAKARELARLDAPYLTASGPGFEAKKAGAFSSVIGAVSGKPETPPDGWFSSSDAANPPIQIVGSYAADRRFRRRGTADYESYLLGNSLGLYPSGCGWAYIHQVSKIKNGWRYETVAKTKTGGKRVAGLFSHWYPSTTVEDLVHTGSIIAMYLDAPAHFFATANYATDENGVVRQTPVIELAMVADNVVDLHALNLPAVEDGYDYAFPEFLALAPYTWVITGAKAGDAPGFFAVTTDAANSWAVYPNDTLMPGYYVSSSYKTEAQIAAAHPSYTPGEVRSDHISQSSVRARLQTSHLTLMAVSARRFVCVAYYPVAGGTKQFTESVVDATTGEVLHQRALPHTVSVAHHRLGRDTWLRISLVSNGATVADITRDGGESYESVALPEVFGTYCTAKPKKPEVGEEIPRIFFANRGATPRRLYRSDDLFVSWEEAAAVSPKSATVSKTDYSTINWVGSPEEPAPIDPVSPWRMDTRFKAPGWWMDGVEI